MIQNNKRTTISQYLIIIVSELRNHLMSMVIIFILYFLLWEFAQTKDLLLVLYQTDSWHKFNMLLFFASLSVLAFLISNVQDYFFVKKIETIPSEEICKKTLLEGLDTEEEAIIQNSESKQSTNKKRDLVPRDNIQIVLKRIDKNYSSKNRRQAFQKQVEITRKCESPRTYVRRMLPKILGTLLILITAFSVYNLEASVNENFNESLLYFGFLLSTTLLLSTLYKPFKDWVLEKFQSKLFIDIFPIAVVILGILIIAVLAVFNYGGTPWDTFRFFLALFLLALVFFTLSTSYTAAIFFFKEYVGVYLVAVAILASLSVYGAFLYNPSWSQLINPLSIINISFIFIFSIITFINYVGRKIHLLFFLTLIFIGAGIYTANRSGSNYYDISSVHTTDTAKDRPQIHNYINKWIRERKSKIEKSECFPVIFVASEGGGSRAGLWAFLIHSELYSRDREYFDSYLFSLTGASGGAVGNALFYNTAFHNPQDNVEAIFKRIGNDNLDYTASKFYQGNFLSSSVTALFGRDPIMSVLAVAGTEIKDRGELVEIEWEEQYQNTIVNDSNKGLDKSYLSLDVSKSKATTTPPILVTNTTHLQSGSHYTISNVDLTVPGLPTNLYKDFFTEYDNTKTNRNQKEDCSIKISTAMLLSSRFPYVSPVGRVRGVGQFADAGYYDNIGGVITDRLVQTFRKVLQQEYSELEEHIDIRVLTIKNMPKKKDDDIDYSTQLLAPINVLAKATFEHSEELSRTYGDDYLFLSKPTEITRSSNIIKFLDLGNKTTVKITPTLPLGRYLSNSAIKSLEVRLKDSTMQMKIDSILRRED